MPLTVETHPRNITRDSFYLFVCFINLDKDKDKENIRQ